MLNKSAKIENIVNVEKALNLVLNKEHKNFLIKHDGGVINDRYILFCSEPNGLKGEDLIFSNGSERGEDGKKYLYIGRDSGSIYIVMEKINLTKDNCAVYFIFHETGDIIESFDSFENFIQRLNDL